MGLRFALLYLPLVISLAACGASHKAAGPSGPSGKPGAAEKPGIGARAGGARGVEAAALPFAILDRKGRQVPIEDFYQLLTNARAVCLGEQHPNPHDHWAQLHLFDQISARAVAKGRPVALGFEMFQRPHQGVLDDYQAGTIDNQTLMSRSGWKKRWSYPFDLYRPMIEMARDRKGTLLALNISTELRKKIRASGIDGLPAADRLRVPAIDLANEAHRAWWNAVMASMGGAHGHGGHGKAGKGHGTSKAPALSEEQIKQAQEKVYLAQLLWDETMADTASRWLMPDPKRIVVILAGNGHCHDSAIIVRLMRRGHGAPTAAVRDLEKPVAPVVLSVRPVIDTGDGEVADAIAKGETDYLFVMTMPAADAATPGGASSAP